MWQIKKEFSAQGLNVGALMGMYALMETGVPASQLRLPIIVFMAFSVEAYINSVGARLITYWDEIERLPWKKKVSILHKALEKEEDWGKNPLQFAKRIFELRDRLAHGKEAVISQTYQTREEAETEYRNFEPDWLREIDQAWLNDAKDKFHALMKYIGELNNLHESDHLRSGTGHLGEIIED